MGTRVDFDERVQGFLDGVLGFIAPVAWRGWLDAATPREYEALVEKNLEVTIDDILPRVSFERANPADLRVDPCALPPGSLPVACHTSGTSGQAKWYPLTREMLLRSWLPGMQAIFEASGVAARSAVVMLVPTRMAGDGLVDVDGRAVALLYSAEFSQRLVLSLLKPGTAIIDEFKRGTSLDVMLAIIDAGRVDAVSAPATTVLAWTRRATVERAIEAAARSPGKASHHGVPAILEKARVAGVAPVARDLHAAFLDAVRQATFIFGTTSVTAAGWGAMRKAFGWDPGHEKVTNVYISSEAGPFAASIDGDPWHLRALPLLLACVDGGKTIEPLSRTSLPDGGLLVTRPGPGGLVVNLDTGDRVFLHGKDGLPVLGPAILRDAFPVKDLNLVPAIVPRLPGSTILAGDYLASGGFRIEIPSLAFDALRETLPGLRKPLVFIGPAAGGDPWTLRACFDGEVPPVEAVARAMDATPETRAHALYHRAGALRVEVMPCPPPDGARATLVREVRAGNRPKGVLKAWAAHVVLRQREGLLHCSNYTGLAT